MMQLICNGIALDLLEDQKIQFTKQNPLFAFDRLVCERSTEITLPDTMTNNGVFASAKRPELYGRQMRVRYDAQLVDGVVVKNGYLYVTEYSNGSYKAVFVTGQLLGLQRIQRAGKLSDLIDPSDFITWPDPTPTRADENKHLWEVVYYGQEKNYLYPSADIAQLAQMASHAVGVPLDLTGTEPELRYIPDVPHGMSRQIVTISSDVIDPSQPSTTIPVRPYNSATCSMQGLFSNESGVAQTRQMSQWVYYRVNQFKANIDANITFPDNFSDDLFLVFFNNSGEHDFLGGYRFENEGQLRKYGEPLAGRTVKILRDTNFIIVDCRDYLYDTTRGNAGWWFGYSGTSAGLEWSFSLEIEGAEATIPTGTVWLRYNLPDITLVDLLKTIAACSGRVLNYDEATGISFDSLEVQSWPRIELEEVISISNVSRRFADFMQRNVIEFDSASNVPDYQRIRLVYRVENDHLEQEKVLQKIPFSEGSLGGRSGSHYILNANREEEADQYTIARCLNYQSMQRVALQSTGIDTLCRESTSVKVTAKLSLFEFEQITPKTAIIIQGVLYVWTDASWSGGRASFTLAKI